MPTITNPLLNTPKTKSRRRGLRLEILENRQLMDSSGIMPADPGLFQSDIEHNIEHGTETGDLVVASQVGAPVRVYVDFGMNWEYDLNEGMSTDEIYDHHFVAPTRVPDYLRSFEDGLIARHETPPFFQSESMFDYNGDKKVDEGDVTDIANDTLAQVAHLFDTFNVEVVLSKARNWDDVAFTLASTPGNDIYVVIPGMSNQDTGISGSGWAPLVDVGNQVEEVVFVHGTIFAGWTETDRVDYGTSGTPGDGFDWNVRVGRTDVRSMSRTLAHEVGHALGLDHTGGETDTIRADLMSYSGLSHGSGFARWNYSIVEDDDHGHDHGDADHGHSQNSYEILKQTVGLKPSAPEFVTGTGAHDVITITPHREGTALVSITPYHDAAHTEPIIEPRVPIEGQNFVDLIHGDNTRPSRDYGATVNYVVSTKNGIIVDGFQGDDHIAVSPELDVDVILRGNTGNDKLEAGSGDDILQGGVGNDILSGNLGSDTYDFSRELWSSTSDEYFESSLHLGRDTIIEQGKDADTLDFSGSDHAIQLSLSKAKQHPHAKLDLVFADPRLLENVIGTDFDDTIIGNDSDNHLQGRGGRDHLIGRGGADTLDGDKNDGKKDVLEGGTGLDVFIGAKDEDVVDPEK